MMKLLGRANSVNVQKVMWLAAETEIEISREDVGGTFGGNDTPEYLARNPMGRIPTLIDGDYCLWESQAIVRYLAEKAGQRPWWPASIEDRGRAHQWMDWYTANMHPPMTAVFWALIRTPPDQVDPEKLKASVAECARLWQMLDAHLADRPYVLGDEISMGDIPAACSVNRWFTMDIPGRPDAPNLKAYYDRIKARPAYQAHVMLPLT